MKLFGQKKELDWHKKGEDLFNSVRYEEAKKCNSKAIELALLYPEQI